MYNLFSLHLKWIIKHTCDRHIIYNILKTMGTKEVDLKNVYIKHIALKRFQKVC